MRRRPFRRPFRRGGPRRVPPELRRANELMEAGHFTQAAEAFEIIARRADARRGPRAPQFHFRTGQAYILAGKVESGMPHIKKALAFFSARSQWEPLYRFGQRAVDKLNDLGHTTQAEEIADYLSNNLPEKTAHTQRTSHKKATLPTHCPGCGAPLRADEVDWIDDHTAECIYCSSPVRGEY
ncbi:MAG: tetratricopeptide repeat protein [Anaerolineales bacterium]|uniref:Tetratricopeptide repeat protein n=1 Tax=Candidatus Desulfolinea nitratireducens TaxID=2841698 RepID=A0A8J6NJ07_9CHLR|nr:tetratricopeptide repeat protein [Candidatus Desulfolinea nitratireducens]